MEHANIINITRFCTDDGPGIRTTVFLKGCPLSCAWCHNPESQNAHPEILWDKTCCIHCGLCASICTTSAHTFCNGVHHYDPKLCTHCGLCAKSCPAGALELSGNQMSTQEVFETVERDMIFYRTSGGGITVSGGEPLVHPFFTAELLKLCKDSSIHTAVETSGFAPKAALEKVLPYCDLLFFDIKETNEAKHKAFTGVSLDPILNNLRYVDELGFPVLLRAPLIPGWNDHEDHLFALRTLKMSLRHCRGLQIMPYHSMGAYKYEKLQRPYLCADVSAPDSRKTKHWVRVTE